MNLRRAVESVYERQRTSFLESESFQKLERGAARPQDYDRFIEGVCRSHLKSPHILAFLFALAPPLDAEKLERNMLEELGLTEENVSHPSLLFKLMEAAKFDKERQKRIEEDAEGELRSVIAQPLLYGTLKELGLSVLIETVAFEWMLSRTASRIATFLCDYRQLSRSALRWFYHHAEVDLRHAAEGLDAIESYARFYEIDALDAETILDATFRENVFIKRYFIN